MAYSLQGSCPSPTSISPPMRTLLASSFSSLHNQHTPIGPGVEDGCYRPLPMKRFKHRICRSSRAFFPLRHHNFPSETTNAMNGEDDDDDDDNTNIENVSDGNSPSTETMLTLTSPSRTFSISSSPVSSSSTITITIAASTTNNNNYNKDVSDGTSPAKETPLVFTDASPTLSSSLVYSSSTTTTNNNINNLEDVSDGTTSPTEEITPDFTHTSPALSSLSSVSSSLSLSSRFRGDISQELEWPLSINKKDGIDVFDKASDPSSCHNPLDNMDSLRIFLPVKRGLSRHYIGKSQSLMSFDAIETVFDLAKSDYRLLKKSRIAVA